MSGGTKKRTGFQKGVSGNPAGRPPGSGWIGKARLELQQAWDGENADGSDGLRKVLIDKAREGDMGALRMVAERVVPPMKALELATEVPLTGATLTDKANAVVACLTSGDLTPAQAAQLLQALGALAKVIETDQLAKRIEALEAKSK